MIKILIDLKDEHTHEHELIRLKLELELSKEKLLELDKKAYSSVFFQSYVKKEFLLQNLTLMLFMKVKPLMSKNLKKEFKEYLKLKHLNTK